MNIKTILFLLFYLLINQYSYTQSQVEPNLKSVILHYFEYYDPPATPERYISFERHPDGYHVVATDQYQNIQSSALLYDFSQAAYLEVSLYNTNDIEFIDEAYPSVQNSQKEKAEHYINLKKRFIKQFDIQPFYGYDGWYDDVIELYQPQSQLNDWELNALARAYRTKAGNLFYDYDSYAVQSELYDLPPGRGHLTEKQISYFLKLHGKCLDAYKQLLKQNPNFITPVGSVYTKYCQEVMDRFLILLINQDEATARSTLNGEEKLFDEFTLKLCRNLLNSCPSNAVLFTWGDGDTFPLYYLQAIESLRTDVVIANTSLVNLPRYIDLIYDPPFGAEPLARSYPDKYLEEVVIMATQDHSIPTSNSINFAEMISLLNSESSYMNIPNYPYNIAKIPNSVKLPVSKDVKAYTDSRIDTIIINPPPYAAADQYLPWDLLWSNNWKRPVCFSITCQGNAWATLKTHIALEGLIYKVYPSNLSPVNYSGQGQINVERSYELWMNVFQWETDEKKKPYKGNAIYQFHIRAGTALAIELMAQGDSIKASNVLQQMTEQMPNYIVPWGSQWLSIMDVACETNNEELGLEIAEQIVRNYIDNQLSDFDVKYKDNAKQHILVLAARYNNDKLLQMVNKL